MRKSRFSEERGSLVGEQATVASHKQAPLLKFHGCSHIDRGSTVWASSRASCGSAR
jgi:hypothetical protein